MKHLIFVLLLSGASVYAQDIITLRNGDEIKARVLEISSSEIRYKRFDNLGGATVVIPRIDVFFINYEDGTREIITPLSKPSEAIDISRSDVSQNVASTRSTKSRPTFIPGIGGHIYIEKNFWGNDIYYDYNNDKLSRNDMRKMLQTKEALDLYNKSIRQQVTGNLLFWPGVGLMGFAMYSIVSDNTSENVKTFAFLGGGGLMVLGSAIMLRAEKNIAISIDMHNRGSNKASVDLRFGFTGNGMGLVLNF